MLTFNIPAALQFLLLADHEGKLLPWKVKLFYILFACFLTTFYLPHVSALNFFFILTIIVYSFWMNSWEEKILLLKKRPAIFFMVAFFVLHVISLFLSEDKQQAFFLITLRSPLLLFPLAVGTLSFSNIFKNRILFLYAVITTLAALLCFTSAMLASIMFSDSSRLYNDWLSDIIRMQSVYLALAVSFAIIIYVYLMLKEQTIASSKIGVFVVLGFLIMIEFMLASRMQLLFLVLALVLFCIYHFIIVRKRAVQALALLTGVVVILFVLVTLFPKTANRFNEFRYPQYSFVKQKQSMLSHYNMEVKPDQWNGVNLRRAIWSCSWELIQTNFLTGIPLGDKDDALKRIYEAKNFTIAIHHRFNMHNTYFDVVATFGIFGLLIFITGFYILPFVSMIQMRDYIGMLIIAAFACAMITETYLERRVGCVIFSFFLSFLLSFYKTSDSSTVH